MSSPLDSPHWYRVRDLAPRLRSHVRVRRHVYRGRRWFVLDDRSAGRTHRIDASAWQLVAGMDGKTTVDTLWRTAAEALDDEAPTQEQFIQLLGGLHSADLVQCDLPPDARSLFQRRNHRERALGLGRLRSPFVLRFSLLDPERWLARSRRLARAIFSRVGLVLWCAVVIAAAVFAGINAPALAAEASARLADPSGLLWLLLVYPLVKALHELGHAMAVKAWGGEVHDTGVMLLVFMPVPYVDATAANAFESKWARMTVAGAGIAVELGLAALGLLVWLLVEPGWVSTAAFHVMVIGGVSTVLFNGNPLLRFDGYFVLADLIEIPNLAARSSAYYGYLIRRYAFGMRDAESPATARGERRWFAVYGLAAAIYKAFILAVIILFVAGISLALGVVLGAWAIAGQWVVPGWRRLRRLLEDAGQRGSRGRGLVATASCVAALVALLAVPLPWRSSVEAVVWLSEDGYVRVGTDCFVERLRAEPNEKVAAGAPLVECADPTLDAELALATARLEELEVRHQAERERGRASGQIASDELAVAQAEAASVRERVERLVVHSRTGGVLVVPGADDLPGRFVRQGEIVGYIRESGPPTLVAALDQTRISRLSDDAAVRVRLAHEPGRELAARIVRVFPGATHSLPSAALGTAGGGRIAVTAGDENGRTAAEPVFQVQLELLAGDVDALTGSRAYVRIDHGNATLAARAWHGLRGLLLKRLAV